MGRYVKKKGRVKYVHTEEGGHLETVEKGPGADYDAAVMGFQQGMLNTIVGYGKAGGGEMNYKGMSGDFESINGHLRKMAGEPMYKEGATTEDMEPQLTDEDDLKDQEERHAPDKHVRDALGTSPTDRQSEEDPNEF